MRALVASLMGLLRETPKEVPVDLQEFEKAKERLRGASSALIREVDEFGKLITGMRPPAPPKKTRRKSGA